MNGELQMLKRNNQLLAILLSVLLCVLIAFCAWSGHYFNDDMYSGVIGGVIGGGIAVFSGWLLATSINKYT
jgi:uncharacterized membrane protein